MGARVRRGQRKPYMASGGLPTPPRGHGTPSPLGPARPPRPAGVPPASLCVVSRARAASAALVVATTLLAGCGGSGGDGGADTASDSSTVTSSSSPSASSTATDSSDRPDDGSTDAPMFPANTDPD